MNHYKLIERFKSHCETKGVHLLKDDVAFLQGCLNGFIIDEARMLLKAYLRKWLTAEKEGLPGRKEANSALRKHLEL